MYERLTEFWDGIWGLSPKAIKQGYDRYSVYSRLAAYEDSGLSPEEVQELKVSVKICEDCWNHAQAKADGRLVVLPCKVGDVIFSHRWNIKNQKYEVHTGEVKNVRYDAADGSVSVSDGERYYYWGKTVFLTREAAEKAIAEVEGESHKKVPQSCYDEFGLDLDGCSRQENQGCAGCVCLEVGE